MSRLYSPRESHDKDGILSNRSHLKRNCACGNKTSGTGACSKCSNTESKLDITTGRGAKSHGPLEVSQPSDSTELEADRISKQLFSSASDIGPRSSQTNSQPSINQVSEFKSVQRQDNGSSSCINASCNRSSSKLLGIKADSGSPLPENTKVEMESAFGTDFSDVRVHTNSGAANVSRSLNASAFTYGNEIFFDHGMYAPNSLAGKQLLAHELTHTVQQRDAIATLARDGEGRTIFECVNQNLSGAGVASWLLAIVGATCGLIGAIAGSPSGPGAAGTAAIGAAVCIAGVIGFSVGTVLGMIGGCWENPNHKSAMSV